MSSTQVSLIVHELLSGETWRDGATSDVITNGYYHIKLDSSSFGMGAAMYIPEGSDKEILQKAIDQWKKQNKWKAKAAKARDEPEEEPVYDETLYQKFVNSIRASHSAYMVHGVCSTLAELVERALIQLDEDTSAKNHHSRRRK